jgi:hypothetical protein
MSSNFDDSLKNEANQNLSFPEKRALATSAGGEISPTPGHLDDRIRLILDEGIDLLATCPIGPGKLV